jgi:hypothetical protein
LRASSSTLSPSARAVPVGAQKWLRESASENASVLRCFPRAIAWRTAALSDVSMTATAQ